MMKRTMHLLASAALFGGVAAKAQTAEQKPPLPIEESVTAKLPSSTDHWVAVATMFGLIGVRIYDGDSGKMKGMVHTASLGNFAADPAGRYFYVAETIWSKGNRGTRQDMLTVRDSHTLQVVREIPLPGRLLVGTRKYTVSVSSDGRKAYVFNMDPATSVIMIDLVRNRVVGSVEVPGCALSAPAGVSRAVSLCSDGTMAVTTMSGKGGKISSSRAFFDSENDPVFDNYPIDPASGSAVFLSYSGLVTQASIGETVDLKDSWSLQEAAGLPRAGTGPLIPYWLPGGDEPHAFHKASNRLYVLMHVGEFWTHKESGTEIWVVDLTTKKVIKRKKLENPGSNISVSQDDKPLLYVMTKEKLVIFDAATLEHKSDIEGPEGMLYALSAGS